LCWRVRMRCGCYRPGRLLWSRRKVRWSLPSVRHR
jgi:hypothetical protein